ncbi:unnamed protein product, partial [Meganyctiphanes norvegica]
MAYELNKLLCVLSLVCWSNQQPTPLDSCEGRPMVDTKQGSICGVQCPDGPVEVCGKKVEAVKTRKYRAFSGIPFAKPPVNELRFKRPVPGEPWNGVRDGSWMPPLCPQFDMMGFFSGNMTLLGQEDCLFLNVYVPEVEAPVTGFPVMVFIHGGGFSMGGIDGYFADKLMRRDVILVNIQYRLGILGFLSTGDEVAPGNLAIKDQELSLRWVQDNIDRFGGDPRKVTIFGESAGGMSVHYQILNPEAKGLFSGAILQSGTALLDFFGDMDQRDMAYQVASKLGCSIQRDGYKSEELLQCLQEIPASGLVKIAMAFVEWGNAPIPFSPRIGEASLPDLPARLLRDGKYNKVDIMMGINQNEGGLFAKYLSVTPNAFKDLETNFSRIGHHMFAMNKKYNDVAKQLFQNYLGGIREYQEDDMDLFAEMIGDYMFDMPHDYSIELHSRDSLYGKNTYAYELKHKGDADLGDLVAPHLGREYVNHGADLIYLFKMMPDLFNETSNPEKQKLESIMLDLWTNFATHGNPTPDRSLGFTWMPVSPKSTDHLVLKPEPYMEADTRCQRRKFFSSLNFRMNQDLFPDRIGAGPTWKPWRIQDLKKC